MTPVQPVQERKRIAAEAAAELVEDGMRVGLGTGSTVAPLLAALARRGLSGVRCVATSPRTAALARELGLAVEEFDSIDALDRLDLAIDGADQVAPDWWVVKGGGGAHTREKGGAGARGPRRGGRPASSPAARRRPSRRCCPRRSRSSCCASGWPRRCARWAT